MHKRPSLPPLLEAKESYSSIDASASFQEVHSVLESDSTQSDQMSPKSAPRSSLSWLSTSMGGIPEEPLLTRIFQRQDMKSKAKVRLEYYLNSTANPSEATLLEISFFERPFGIWLVKKEVFRIDNPVLCELGLTKHFEIEAVKRLDSDDWMLLKDEDDIFVQELVAKAELPFTIRFRNPEPEFLDADANSDGDDELAYLGVDTNDPLAFMAEDTIGGANPDEDELAYFGATDFGGAVVENENAELWEDEWV